MKGSDLPIRIAVQLQPIHATYAALRRAVDEVDGLGVDILFNSDHFFPATGDATGLCFEAWTTLAAWAEQTSNVKLGVSVSGSTYRNAHLMADMARTVDHISNGRAILGLGSGWFAKDHAEYGFDFPESSARIERFEKHVDAILYRLPRLNPLPVQPKLPVMIGNGGDRKPPALVARGADIWLDFKPAQQVSEYNAELDLECGKIGRAPSAIERGAAVPGNDLSRIDEFRKAGCTLFMLRFMGPDFDLGEIHNWIAWRDRMNGR